MRQVTLSESKLVTKTVATEDSDDVCSRLKDVADAQSQPSRAASGSPCSAGLNRCAMQAMTALDISCTGCSALVAVGYLHIGSQMLLRLLFVELL